MTNQKTLRDYVSETWRACDWELVNHLLPEHVRAEAAARGVEDDLAALLAICDELTPGYLDATQF